jgi:hypothetical protein
MLAGWATMRFIGQIPDWASKTVAAYGIATLLDPIMIFLIDVMASHHNCSQVRRPGPPTTAFPALSLIRFRVCAEPGLHSQLHRRVLHVLHG